MKKAILLAVSVLLTLSASAQYRDVKMPEKPHQTGYRDYESQDNGFWYAFEAEGGSTIMEHQRNMQFADVTFTGGYRINEFLRVGAGFGGRMYVNNSEVRYTNSKFGVPIFANVRGNFISAYDRDGVPFWSVRLGGITNEGVYFSPSVGYSFGGLRNDFIIGIAYTLTNLKDFTGSRQTYSSFGLRLGYEF